VSDLYGIYEYDGEPYWHIRNVSAEQALIKLDSLSNSDSPTIRIFVHERTGFLTEISQEELRDKSKAETT